MKEDMDMRTVLRYGVIYPIAFIVIMGVTGYLFGA